MPLEFLLNYGQRITARFTNTSMPNDVRALIEKLRSTRGCTVAPARGRPNVGSYELPDDLATFFGLCGGATLFEGADYGIRIVSPDRFGKANPIIAGVEGEGDISQDWFLVAESGEQYVSIDLGKGRVGRCYDSFWDRHAVAGSCAVIAQSFSELLEKLIEGRGTYWYWLKPEFAGYGDAYQGIAPHEPTS